MKDVFFVKYKSEEGGHLTILGINEQLPERISNAPAHFIAMYYEKGRFEAMGGKITDMEFKYDLSEEEIKRWGRKNVFFDYKGIIEEENEIKNVVIEVKHGYEGGDIEDLKKNADLYLYITEKEDWILMYRFYEEPESVNAIGLFNYLKELAKAHPGIRIYINNVEYRGE